MTAEPGHKDERSVMDQDIVRKDEPQGQAADAAKAVKIPIVEVHSSKVEEREEFRQVSYIRAACVKTITGHGINGYIEAMQFLMENYGQ